MRVRLLPAVAVAALGLTACGATRSPGVVAPGPATVPPVPSSHALVHATTTAVRGRELISFRRAFGTDPLASALTVYTGGQSVATLGYGGRNGLQVHRFRMPGRQLRRLLSLVRHTRLRTTGVGGVHYYVYWIITDRGSYRLCEGQVPRAARPLIAQLNAITDQRTGW